MSCALPVDIRPADVGTQTVNKSSTRWPQTLTRRTAPAHAAFATYAQLEAGLIIIIRKK